MRRIDNILRPELLWLALLTGFLILLGACTTGVSEERVEDLEQALRSAQASIQSLEANAAAFSEALDRLQPVASVSGGVASGGASALEDRIATLERRLDRGAAIQKLLDLVGQQLGEGGEEGRTGPSGEFIQDPKERIQALGIPSVEALVNEEDLDPLFHALQDAQWR